MSHTDCTFPALSLPLPPRVLGPTLSYQSVELGFADCQQATELGCIFHGRAGCCTSVTLQLSGMPFTAEICCIFACSEEVRSPGHCQLTVRLTKAQPCSYVVMSFYVTGPILGVTYGASDQPCKRRRTAHKCYSTSVLATIQPTQVADLAEGLEAPVQLVYLVTLLGFLVVGAYLVVRQVHLTTIQSLPC